MSLAAHQESSFAKYGINGLSAANTKPNKNDFATRVAGEIEIVFSHLNGHEKASLLSLGDIEMFDSGAKIISQGELADALYMIIDGETCEVRGDGTTVKNLDKGVYGHASLLKKHPEPIDIIANGEVFAFKMRNDILTKLMRFNAFFSERLEICLNNRFQLETGEIKQVSY